MPGRFNVAVVDANENVGLACAVEEFAPGIAFKLCVEADEQHVSDFFPVELGGDRWGALQRVPLVTEHPKCGLVVLILHCRLRLECCPRARWAVWPRTHAFPTDRSCVCVGVLPAAYREADLGLEVSGR